VAGHEKKYIFVGTKHVPYIMGNKTAEEFLQNLVT
jgi:hypothetical protein